METDVLIIERFFEAIETLSRHKIIRGLATFTKRCGANRRNVQHMRKDIAAHAGMFRVSWLAMLVSDYKVSPLWLLTGDGAFFMDGWSVDDVLRLHGKEPKKAQIKRKRGRPRKYIVENQLFASE